MGAGQGATRTYAGWGGLAGRTVAESRSWWPATPRPQQARPTSSSCSWTTWASGLAAGSRGAVRTEYQYVTDLLPTLLELAGVRRPRAWLGHDAPALDGTSFAASLNDPGYRSRHLEQYSEFNGNRSFYRDGWKLVTLHGPGEPYDDRGTLESVTYQPGDPAPYSPEAVLRATIDAAHAFE